MKVAVLGATGLVGGEMLRVLEQRGFPVDELVPLASQRSAGRTVTFRGEECEVQAVSESAFSGVDVAIFSAGSGPSRKWAPVAAEAGAVVIDNSSAWRMDPEVPLVVPEVNPGAALNHRGIIANPNCSTIQAVTAIYPLHLAAGLEYVHYVSFQSVSGTGTAALDELTRGSRAVLEGGEFEPSVYPHPIAFNVLPHIGDFDEEGHTQEEWKMVNESRKIMGIPELKVSCTTTRVPVYRSHSESVTVQFGRDLSPDEARSILSAAPGIVVADDPQKALYPLATDAADRDPVYVGRIRRDLGLERALTLWVVADNIRKGAALNAVQIAETLLSEGRLG